jgi:CRISPR-associated protein Csm1
MEDNTIYYIALAGLLHDIGKFAERAEEDAIGKVGFHKDPIKEWLNNNAQLFQPKYNNNYTHRHSLFTAATINLLSEAKVFPDVLAKSINIGNNSVDFLSLAAKHHLKENDLNDYEKIIKKADRLASGFERTEYENYEQENQLHNYKRTRLNSIFENICKNQNEFSYNYKYKSLTFDKDSIFPTKDDREISEKEYTEHFVKFIEDAKKIKHKNNIKVWLDHFDSLYMIYTSNIPSFTVGKNPPYISLYDHSRTTAIIASALYKYYESDKRNNKSFLLINGNFYGIQDFIFSGFKLNKKSSKILRAKSFYVSLLTEILALKICEEIGLTSLSIIVNNAGKFLILSHNTEEVIKKVKKIEEDINNWLIDNFYGEVSIGITYKEASEEDLQINEINKLLKNLFDEVENKKYNKFNLFKYSGMINDYPQKANEICPICGKRKGEKDYSDDNEKYKICKMCSDFIFIGEEVVKSNKIIIYKATKNVNLLKLTNNIFNEFQVSFKKNEEIITENILKYWDISMDNISKNVTAKFLNSYVSHNDSGKIKDFEELSLESKGANAIAVLKADIDNLGKIFQSIPNYNFSSYSNISRQINNFFVLWLPRYLKENKKNVYTVFAGGDDLFLIGSWNEIIELASDINDKFKEYVCSNPKITISCGITLHKPSTPVKYIRDSAELALEKSKHNKDKNSITIFDKTDCWDKFKELIEFKKSYLEKWEKEEKVSMSYVYLLSKISEMVTVEEEKEKFTINDMYNLKWKSLLGYYTVRNFKGDDKERNEVINKLINFFNDYKSKTRIPLWYFLYERREKK